jgi:hypothetical protein
MTFDYKDSAVLLCSREPAISEKLMVKQEKKKM